MSQQKPRLTFTPTDPAYIAVHVIAKATGTPVSTVVADTFALIETQLIALADVYTAVSKARAQLLEATKQGNGQLVLEDVTRSQVDALNAAISEAKTVRDLLGVHADRDDKRVAKAPNRRTKSAPLYSPSDLRDDQRQLAAMGIQINRTERRAIEALERREAKHRGRSEIADDERGAGAKPLR